MRNFSCDASFTAHHYIEVIVGMSRKDDDSYYFCFCHQHVHKATRYHCVVATLTHLPFTIHGFFTKVWWYAAIAFLLGVTSIVCYCCLFYANVKLKPHWYWPFFIVNSIVKTLTLLVVIGMCVCGILVLFGHFNVRDEYRNTIGALTVVFAILYLFVILFQVYIGTIVYRDWIYIKELNIDNRKE
ncbi:hypothetical protein M3Y95_01107800 [Aphelenchoides besseyi]|nr:hypothetical protein M3Y95_01107800 [Aphelenchoides besseyi]